MTISRPFDPYASLDLREEGGLIEAVQPVYPFEDMFTSALLPVDVMVEAVDRLMGYRKTKIH